MNSRNIEYEGHGITVIDSGKVTVHVFGTNDPLSDQVIVLESKGLLGRRRGVVIEQPCFRETIPAAESYIRSTGMSVEGKLIAYHAAGSTFMPDVKAYMTEEAKRYNSVGGGAGLIGNFTQVFGDAFDGSITDSDETISAGDIEIAGVRMRINPDSDAYEIEIPEAKAVYMHMLGHDCHSIVAGPAQADAIIANLQSYLDRGFELFLSSHYGPESREDVGTKIGYLNGLKDIASGCSSAEEFKAAVTERYPGYSGENYLDMTAGFFYQH